MTRLLPCSSEGWEGTTPLAQRTTHRDERRATAGSSQVGGGATHLCPALQQRQWGGTPTLQFTTGGGGDRWWREAASRAGLRQAILSAGGGARTGRGRRRQKESTGEGGRGGGIGSPVVWDRRWRLETFGPTQKKNGLLVGWLF